MKKSILSRSGRRQAACPEEAAFLDLLRTCDLLSRAPALVLKAEDLSATQYNVLRILRGAPEGLPCGEIGSRMITRDPDITRLLDRLEKRELISRCRETKDRRMVMARITPEGAQAPGPARCAGARGPSQAVGAPGTGAASGAHRAAAGIPDQSELIFLGDIFVATNIVGTHLKQAERINHYEHTGCTANRYHHLEH